MVGLRRGNGKLEKCCRSDLDMLWLNLAFHGYDLRRLGRSQIRIEG